MQKMYGKGLRLCIMLNIPNHLGTSFEEISIMLLLRRENEFRVQ